MGVTINKKVNKPETLKIWGLSIHIYSIREEDLANISSPERNEGQAKHKEKERVEMNQMLKIEKSYEGSLRYVLTRLTLQIIHNNCQYCHRAACREDSKCWKNYPI